MIQPNELRIGNYVFDRGGKVLRIDFFEYLENGYSCKFGQKIGVDGWGEVHPLTEYTDYAKPIPLTEEWLLKFGFEKQHNEDDFDYWFKKGFCDDILWEHSEGFCHNLNYGGDIKNVHQLQNIYFALTGEELSF